MNRLALALIVVSCCFIAQSMCDDEYVLVEGVEVSGDDEHLDESKEHAIQIGKRIALDKVLEKLNKRLDLTKQQVEDCIDSYSIKSENFIKNTYHAKVNYRIDMASLERYFKKRNGYVKKMLLPEPGRSIIVNTDDVLKIYKRVSNICRQYSMRVYPLLFSNRCIVYPYSEQLNGLLMESHINVKYTTAY